MKKKQRKPKGFETDTSEEEDEIMSATMKEVPIEDMTQEEIIDEVAKYTIEEAEIDYLISLLKKDDVKGTDDISRIYMSAKHTFHLLMCRLGQMQTYEHIMDIYRNHVNLNELKDTVIKLLLRCAYAYECLERCRIIFKMQKRHSKLLMSLGMNKGGTGGKAADTKSTGSSKSGKPKT